MTEKVAANDALMRDPLGDKWYLLLGLLNEDNRLRAHSLAQYINRKPLPTTRRVHRIPLFTLIRRHHPNSNIFLNFFSESESIFINIYNIY